MRCNWFSLTFILSVTLLVSPNALAESRSVSYVVDARGNPALEIGDNGIVKNRPHYDPYGQAQNVDVVMPSGKGVSLDYGQSLRIGASNLVMGVRVFSTDLRMFASPDPVDFVDGGLKHLSAYAYAYGNPYTYIDLDGRAATKSTLSNCPLEASCRPLTGGFGVPRGSKGFGVYRGELLPNKMGTLKSSSSGGVPKGTKPAISAQKQAGHIPGTPQNANRLKQGKPTSSFFGEKSGERLTQQAFEKGKPVPGRPNVREHDFGVSTGTGPNGGMQSRVRVHQDSKGRIHGHPSGPERY